jgi:hypothetical protein
MQPTQGPGTKAAKPEVDRRGSLPKDISKAPAPNIRRALRGDMDEEEMAELLYRINNGSLAHELYPEQYPDLAELWKPS